MEWIVVRSQFCQIENSVAQEIDLQINEQTIHLTSGEEETSCFVFIACHMCVDSGMRREERIDVAVMKEKIKRSDQPFKPCQMCDDNH